MADQQFTDKPASQSPADGGSSASTIVAATVEDTARLGKLPENWRLMTVAVEGSPATAGADEVLYVPSGTSAGRRQFAIVDLAKRAGYNRLVIVPPGTASPRAVVADLVDALDDADLVIASAHDGNPSWLSRTLQGIGFDVTSQFQAFNLKRLPTGLLEIVGQTADQSVLLFPMIAEFNGHPLRQVRAAATGVSGAETTRPSFINVFALAMQMKMAAAQFRHVEPFRAPDSAQESDEQKAWDSYWTHGSHSGKWLYDLIAAFYRAFIIRPAVNKFINRNFAPGAKLMHAGCGSGMVDVDIAKHMHITALDISPAGLTEYSRHHERADLLLGSIFEMPVADESYDGIFNLGVMEHFHEHELDRIFPEVNRILKTGGRAVLFWPPQWGLSVNVIRLVHWWLHKVVKSDIELHPPEYTRVHSKAQIQRWCDMAGFTLKDFYFGPRDLFTHQIVVLEKTGTAAG